VLDALNNARSTWRTSKVAAIFVEKNSRLFAELKDFLGKSSGYAHLLAIEMSGRPAVIEIKLAKNAEARRAVVAQVLAYAAYLQGLTPEQLECDVLGAKLRKCPT
jgi:hypothetical protein